MSTAKGTALQLTQQPEIVTWPETHYVYLEKIGPFQDTAPQAWQEVHKLIPAISEHNKITGYTSLYKVGPKIYRAGVSVEAEPQNLPAGLQYTKFKGGKYKKSKPATTSTSKTTSTIQEPPRKRSLSPKS